MFLGDRLHFLRDRKQITLRQLTQRSGLSQSFLLRVENGHAVPDLEQIEHLAAALEVPVHQLFCENPPLQNLPDCLSEDDIARLRIMERLNGILNKLP